MGLTFGCSACSRWELLLLHCSVQPLHTKGIKSIYWEELKWGGSPRGREQSKSQLSSVLGIIKNTLLCRSMINNRVAAKVPHYHEKLWLQDVPAVPDRMEMNIFDSEMSLPTHCGYFLWAKCLTYTKIFRKDFRSQYLSPRENTTELGKTLYFPLCSQKFFSQIENQHIFKLKELPTPNKERNPCKKPTDEARSAANS